MTSAMGAPRHAKPHPLFRSGEYNQLCRWRNNLARERLSGHRANAMLQAGAPLEEAAMAGKCSHAGAVHDVTPSAEAARSA